MAPLNTDLDANSKRSDLFGKIKETYKGLPLPAKASAWFTICNFILKGISFISGPLFTRLLVPEEYGTLSVFISYEQFILILATWEIQLGAYQKGIFKYKDDVNFFTTASQALINILTVGFFLIVFLFHKTVSRFTGMPVTILLLLFVYLLVCPAYYEWLTRKRKAYDYKAGVTLTLLYSIVNVLLPMGALLVFERTANVKFSFTLIGSSVICLFFFVKHMDYWKIPGRWEQTKQYWKYCLVFEGPLVFHSLSYLILAQADRVMIRELIGSRQAAFYSVAHTIAGVVIIFQSSINVSLSPWRYQMLEDKNYGAVKKVTSELLVAFWIMITLFILFVPEMMKIIFPIEYFEAVWCIPPVSSGVFFIFLYSIFVNIEEYYERTTYVVYVSVTCGIINIVLNYCFINIFGYIACAYTTLFSYMLFAAGHYYFMRKTLKMAQVKEDVVNGKVTLMISGLVILCSVLATILYKMPLIRYGLLLCGATILFIKRKEITNAYKQIKKRENTANI